MNLSIIFSSANPKDLQFAVMYDKKASSAHISEGGNIEYLSFLFNSVIKIVVDLFSVD